MRAFEENQRDSTVHQKTIDDGSLSVTNDQRLVMFQQTVARTHSDALAMNHRKRALTAADLNDDEQAKKKQQMEQKKNEAGMKMEPGAKRSLAEALDQSPLAAMAEGALGNPKAKAIFPKAKMATAAPGSATTNLKGKDALLDLTNKALAVVKEVKKSFCESTAPESFDEAAIAPAAGLLKGKEDKLVKADLYDKVTEVRAAAGFCKAITVCTTAGQESTIIGNIC